MARSKSKPEAATLSDQLRAEIAASGLTHYAIGQLAGVDTQQVRRYALGQRDLTTETAGRIASALGLVLVRRRGGPALGYSRSVGFGPEPGDDA